MNDSELYEARIGKRIKEQRQSQGLSIRELSRRIDLSVSFLSQVERGLVSISINSLRKIAEALDVSILYFLDDRVDYNPVIREGKRQRISLPGYSDIYCEIISPNLGQKAEAVLVRLKPGKEYSAQVLRSPTDEAIYMISGSILIEIDHREFTLNGGDSVCFKGASLNRIESTSEEEAVWIWIVTPPVF